MPPESEAPAETGVSPEVQEFLLDSPLHRFLGLRMLRYGDGEAEILLPFREEIVGSPHVPYIHGGIIATLLDIAGDYAIASTVGRDVPTIDMRVDYLRTAGLEDLIGTGRAIRVGRTIGVADAEVRNRAGQLLAVGRILYSTK